MKTSSADAPKTTPDKATRWACVVANALALPGLGSIAAGRKVGYAQAAIAAVGFAGSMLSMLAYLWQWVDRGEMPKEITNPALIAAFASISVFAVAWFWALKTSLDLYRKPPRLTGTGAPPTLPPGDQQR